MRSVPRMFVGGQRHRSNRDGSSGMHLHQTQRQRRGPIIAQGAALGIVPAKTREG